MSSKEGNPLGGRGKAAEDDWARRQDREAIEKMRKKDKKSKGKPAAGQTAQDGDKDGKAG
jgi:hypothetical protein